MADRTSLIDAVKAALRVEDLIAKSVPLRPCGSYLVGLCPFHDERTGSFKVSASGQFFKCYGCGQSGDALSWLAFERFGRTKVLGAEFLEVLRFAAEIVGLPFIEGRAAHDVAAAERRRAREDVLARYVDLAASLWSIDDRLDAFRLKPYLRDEGVLRRWRLGRAPTLDEAFAAGLKRDELRDLGLLRQAEGETPRLLFRSALVIPFFERGRCVYAIARRLRDRDEGGSRLDGAFKVLNLPSPLGVDGVGLLRPVGFNVDIIFSAEAREHGLRLVEGALDAIALTEQGHPAVAMLGTNPQARLLEMVGRAIHEGERR